MFRNDEIHDNIMLMQRVERGAKPACRCEHW